MLVFCTSRGKERNFTANDTEALAAVHTNSGSGSKLGTVACTAKKTFMPTVVAMKEAQNTAKIMEIKVKRHVSITNS